jgi:hypothetical protein
LRNGAPARSEEDYAILRKYAALLDADIIALQEVNGPKAAALVFPEEQYTFHFSGRYVEDTESDANTSDHIFEGFAVRRGVFDAVTKRDYPQLSVTHTDGHPVRWGTELLVEKGPQRLLFLSLRLKSGCAEGSLQSPSTDNCVTLAKQRQPLNAWVDEHTTKGVPFVMLGDFNRAFDKFGASDHLWSVLNDGEPPGLNYGDYHSTQNRTAGRIRQTGTNCRSTSLSLVSRPNRSSTKARLCKSCMKQAIRRSMIKPRPIIALSAWWLVFKLSGSGSTSGSRTVRVTR